MSPFDEYLHTIIVRAEQEARDDGSATIEAQHLLLAVASEREATTHRVLASVGFEHEAVREALDREFDHSLSTVGVSRAALEFPRPSRVPAHPRMGASAKRALERGFASVVRKKDLRPAHVLLGILQAEVGTVPRALALSGVDRVELTARARRTLTDEGGAE